MLTKFVSWAMRPIEARQDRHDWPPPDPIWLPVEAARIQKVAVCVCTRARPKMLERCLDSLGAQLVPANVAMSIIIASNGPGHWARTAGVFERFKAVSPFPVGFTHEEEPGIAAARNTACALATFEGADWIAFIDDDEVADPDWIANLMAPDYLRVPVLMGANVVEYPAPIPFWAPRPALKGKEGQLCKTAYTGNVRFSARLLADGLRFNEGLGLMGGEDNEFFAAAHARGYPILRTLKAVTRETAHARRLTYSALVYRSYWCAASEYRRLIITRGRLGAALRKAHTIPLNIVFAVFWYLAALGSAAFSRELFRQTAIDGGLKLAKAAGRLAALCGHQPQPYRIIDGE